MLGFEILRNIKKFKKENFGLVFKCCITNVECCFCVTYNQNNSVIQTSSKQCQEISACSQRLFTFEKSVHLCPKFVPTNTPLINYLTNQMTSCHQVTKQKRCSLDNNGLGW